MPETLRNLSTRTEVAVDSASSPTATPKEVVRCKGVQRAVARRIPFSEYQRTLETHQPRHDVTYAIRSRNHQLHIERLFKLSLKLADDKRFWISPLNSLSHGNVLANQQLRRLREAEAESEEKAKESFLID